VIDYGRVEWNRLQAQGKHQPEKLPALLRNFREGWCRNSMLATWTDDKIRWVLAGPTDGFVFQVH
jgi:hypothetical protein